VGRDESPPEEWRTRSFAKPIPPDMGICFLCPADNAVTCEAERAAYATCVFVLIRFLA